MLLREISMQTKDAAVLRNFYADVMGLPVYENSKIITIGAGETKLSFEPAASSNPFYHFAFNIPSNKIQEATEWLNGKVELLWIDEYEGHIAEFTTWNARSVYFFDPAGNIVELIGRADLGDDPVEAFSAAQIRNVSEIGIVFSGADFDKQVDELIQKFQLDYFSKQAPMKHFRAFGNDEGLFIVVPDHRNWYPTNIASEMFPLSIKFLNDGKEYELQL